MKIEISLRSVMIDDQELANQARERHPASWRQRMEMLLREIFEGHAEFLGLTPD